MFIPLADFSSDLSEMSISITIHEPVSLVVMGFPRMVVLQNGCFTMNNPVMMDDLLGIPPQETSRHVKAGRFAELLRLPHQLCGAVFRGHHSSWDAQMAAEPAEPVELLAFFCGS